MLCAHILRRNFIFILLTVFLSKPVFAQPSFYNDEKYKWADNKPVELPKNIEAYSGYHLVVLNEKTEFNYRVTVDGSMLRSNHRHFSFSSSDSIPDESKIGKLSRNLLIKINTAKGLDILKTMSLPESFDYAFDACQFKQGRKARIKIPATKEYKVKMFMARKFSKGRWEEVKLKDRYTQARRIKPEGDFSEEEITNYELQDLEAGDIIEIYYEAGFMANYGTNIFYFNSAYPKIKCEYDFTYRIDKAYAGYNYIFPIHVADSLTSRTYSQTSDYYTQTRRITLTYLKAINYPANSFEGKELPHVSVDFNFTKTVNGSFPDGSARVFDYKFIRPKNFEWLIIGDTVNHYTKVYNKQFEAIKKFTSTLPPLKNDSTNTVFFKALCDTLNEFRYMTMNHLFYNEPNLYNVSSGDHLLKRRLAGGFVWKIYEDILYDNTIFYYLVNVEDKRYGEHSAIYKAHSAYEANLVAIPNKGSYNYFMPRYNGIKYHLNELPFYYEGVLGALKPQNFQADVKNKENSFFKFIKTHKGTYNENTRTENTTVKISLDSLKTSLLTKESLSGQFSTVLRHLYLGEYIDSTISPFYFKKCTSKPHALNAKIKLSSKITDYPFRYTFNCTEKIPLVNKTSLDLSNWFSFILSKASIPEAPTHDYYFDFEFSDSYNFLLDFDSAVELKNATAFSKKINNEVAELESEIVKNSESSYLLKVKVLVKQAKVAEDKAALLMDLVSSLDALNNFTLEIEKK